MNKYQTNGIKGCPVLTGKRLEKLKQQCPNRERRPIVRAENQAPKFPKSRQVQFAEIYEHEKRVLAVDAPRRNRRKIALAKARRLLRIARGFKAQAAGA
jgi:hypothetical protein